MLVSSDHAMVLEEVKNHWDAVKPGRRTCSFDLFGLIKDGMEHGVNINSDFFLCGGCHHILTWRHGMSNSAVEPECSRCRYSVRKSVAFLGSVLVGGAYRLTANPTDIILDTEAELHTVSEWINGSLAALLTMLKVERGAFGLENITGQEGGITTAYTERVFEMSNFEIRQLLPRTTEHQNCSADCCRVCAAPALQEDDTNLTVAEANPEETEVTSVDEGVSEAMNEDDHHEEVSCAAGHHTGTLGNQIMSGPPSTIRGEEGEGESEAGETVLTNSMLNSLSGPELAAYRLVKMQSEMVKILIILAYQSISVYRKGSGKIALSNLVAYVGLVHFQS